MTQRLAGRVAVITGAASGIGAASVEVFRAEGARVLAVDVRSEGLRESDGVATLVVDIAEDEAPARIVAAAQDRFGGLDVLFNNAGVAVGVPAAEMSDADWDRVMAVNLRGVFRLSRAATPALVASGRGRILNTASVMAECTDFGLAAYAASKAGIAGLTRTLALELGPAGVTANYLLPGAIKTKMTEPVWQAHPDAAEVWRKKAAVKRLGLPEDIAHAAAFLASDDAAFITGHGLVVDGGMMLRA